MTLTSDAEFVGLQSIVQGRYSLERRIGRGGMGEVFLARDLALDRPIALKLLPLAYSSDQRARQRFLREARTAARLSHPHIVPIHSVEEHQDFVFFAMAYVDGETLADRVRRSGPLGVTEATRVLREVAWALAYAHQLGIIHRDIKPENILLEHGSGRALVSDFGIARVHGSTVTGNVGEMLGTLAYMSPEQIAGTPLDGRSDLYSLGVTLFFTLTTRHPYRDGEKTPSVTLLRPDLPRAIAEAVDRCLALDPADRFLSGEELAASLGESPTSVEQPMVLRRYARVVRALGQELVTSLALTVAILVTSWEARDIGHRIAEPLYAITPTLVTMAVVLLIVRFIRVVLRARVVLAASLRFEDARAILPGGAQATVYRSADRPRRHRPLRIAAWMLGLVGIAVAWHYLFRYVMAGADSAGGYIWVGVVTAMLITLVRRLLAHQVFRPDTPGLWNALWRGRFGRWIFDLASFRISRSRVAAAAHAPEVMLAGAVNSMVSELGPGLEHRLAPILAAVRRVESECGDMRARGRQLDELLRHTATGSDIKPTSDLAEHRRSVVDEINEARAENDASLSRRIAQLESLRLELLRLRAGLGDIDSVFSRVQQLDSSTSSQQLLQPPAPASIA